MNNNMNSRDGGLLPNNKPIDASPANEQRVDFTAGALLDGKVDDEGEEHQRGGGYNDNNANNAPLRKKEDPPAASEDVHVLQTPAQMPRDSLTGESIATTTTTAATNPDSLRTTVSRFGRDFSRLMSANTPGNNYFASMGQTPMTGASLGSHLDPTPQSSIINTTTNPAGILKSSNYKTNVNAMSMLNTTTTNNNNNDIVNEGMSAMGLVRGLNPLGPTPLVRRNDPGRNVNNIQQLSQNQQYQSQQQQQHQQLPTPSPGMHYHLPAASAASGVKTFDELPPKKRLSTTNEEEDPAMLRYASTAGSDQSPLVAKKGETNPEPSKDDNVMQGSTDATPRPNRPQTLPDGILRDPSASAFTPRTDHHQRQQQLQPTPTSEMRTPGSTTPAALTEFPFYFDGYASWVCRHCNHINPYYRGENYIWHFPQAPPNEFVDLHLIVCPGLNGESEATASSQQQSPFHSTLPQAGMAQQPMMMQQPMTYDKKQASAPDPPTGRSPPMLPPPKVGKSDESSQQYYPPSQQQQSYPTQAYQPGQPPPYAMMPHQQPPYPMMPPPPPGGAQQPPFPFGLSGVAGPVPARKQRKSTGKNVSPKGRPVDDGTYIKAMEHLEDADELATDLTKPGSDVGSSLVEPSDSDLITDYFFHIMKQLVVCRFAEKDRKTRGGKRENINIGYGGLQCRHCINASSSRKFFWSNVDRLANSFAEIPTHVLKCKSIPDDIKDALLVLKGRHAEQMQSLARGSQKVFFRRMWRRLHDGDGTCGATPLSEMPSRDDSESSNVGDNASKKTGEVDPNNPARVLAASLAAESSKAASPHQAALTLAQSGKTEESEPTQQQPVVVLAISEDKDWLSDDQCFVRSNIEVFVANIHDCAMAAQERKYPVKPGWVGIRCLHCARTPGGARGAAVCYPYSVSGIYESVREFQRLHFEKCPNLPPDVVAASMTVNKASTTLSSVLRRYYVQSARALGLVDNPEGGMAAGAKPEAVSRAGFAAAASPGRAMATPRRTSSNLDDSANLLLQMSRKRKAELDPFDEVHSPSKRQNTDDDAERKEAV
eukprot:scaffold816_cov43-Cyclotella_meneghiniana.AAC.5